MLQSIDEKLKNELASLEKKCMAPNDVDQFVSCMENTVEKIEREQKNLEFRMAFLQYSTSECLKRAKEGKGNLDTCKDTTRKAVSSYIDFFIQQIRK